MSIPDDIRRILIREDAIRLVDGRYRDGFVDTDTLKRLVKAGALVEKKRHGMSFAMLPKAKLAFHERVYTWLRNRGAVEAKTVGSSAGMAIDTVFGTPLLVTVLEPGFIALRFQRNAASLVTREIRNVHDFNPCSGKWNIQFTLGGPNARIAQQKNIFRTADDEARLDNAAFEELKLRVADVCVCKRIIRDR